MRITRRKIVTSIVAMGVAAIGAKKAIGEESVEIKSQYERETLVQAQKGLHSQIGMYRWYAARIKQQSSAK
jgi:hypothetical protein